MLLSAFDNAKVRTKKRRMKQLHTPLKVFLKVLKVILKNLIFEFHLVCNFFLLTLP